MTGITFGEKAASLQAVPHCPTQSGEQSTPQRRPGPTPTPARHSPLRLRKGPSEQSPKPLRNGGKDQGALRGDAPDFRSGCPACTPGTAATTSRGGREGPPRAAEPVSLLSADRCPPHSSDDARAARRPLAPPPLAAQPVRRRLVGCRPSIGCRPGPALRAEQPRRPAERRSLPADRTPWRQRSSETVSRAVGACRSSCAWGELAEPARGSTVRRGERQPRAARAGERGAVPSSASAGPGINTLVGGCSVGVLGRRD